MSRFAGIAFVVGLGCGGSSGATPDAAADVDATASAVEDLVTGVVDPRTIAVDVTHLYFAHAVTEISRVVKTGSSAVTSITTGQRGPARLDATTDRLCWVNTGTHSQDFLDGSVRCAAKTGGSEAELSSSVFPSSLAIANDTIFWVEIDGQRVRTIGVDGTAAQTLDTSPTHKTAIAITETKLAWTASGDLADVVAMDRGTGVNQTLSSSEYAPGAVLIAGEDVYWLVLHALSDTGAVRVSRAGAAPIDVVSDEYYPEDLVQVAGTLYWTSNGRIRAVDVTGGAARTLAADRGEIGGLASDGAYLYWTEPARGAIVRMPL